MATPIKEIKFGSIKVAVWENTGTGKDGQPFTTTSPQLCRSYKDKDGKWVNLSFSLRNTTDVVNTIQCLQEYLDYKYKKDELTEPKI